MSDREQKISDELLNAYLDNELGSEERDDVLHALDTDAGLSRRLCELRNVKELTQHAYAPAGHGKQESARRRSGAGKSWYGIAASLAIMLVGSLLGWFAHSQLQQPVVPQIVHQQAALPSAALGSLQQVTDEKRIILHVNTADAGKFTAALDSAEDLLQSYAESNRSLELEIIANAQGLDLLRADVTPHALRIRELVEKYDNLSMLACHRAIQRLEEMGVKVQLVPEARIAPSALEQIIQRLQQGWVYIKV